jgi:hypothetical protein
MMGDDFEPMVKAAENAIRMQEIAVSNTGGEEEFDQRKDCVTAWEKIGQYCSPKLKAIEVSGEVKSVISSVLESIQEENDGLPETDQ